MILSVSQSRSGERMKHKLVLFPLDGNRNNRKFDGSFFSRCCEWVTESDVITFRVVCLGVCYLTWNCWQKLTVLEFYSWFFIFLLYVLFLNPSAVFLHVFNSEKTRERDREAARAGMAQQAAAWLTLMRSEVYAGLERAEDEEVKFDFWITQKWASFVFPSWREKRLLIYFLVFVRRCAQTRRRRWHFYAQDFCWVYLVCAPVWVRCLTVCRSHGDIMTVNSVSPFCVQMTVVFWGSWDGQCLCLAFSLS